MNNLRIPSITLLLLFFFATHTSAQLEFYDQEAQKNISLKTAHQFRMKTLPPAGNFLRSANPAWFEEYMISMQEELLYPGVSACVLKGGQVFWKSHHGLANVWNAIPVTDETAYTVASISKTIMITAVMQLYEQQLFDLDDDISDHIPFLVRNYNFPDDIITIKQLMTHTSSIGDNYTILNDHFFLGGDNPVAMDDFLEGYLTEGGEYFMTQNFYAYGPGSTINYTNVGSCLLAYLVEVLSGQDFESYCQEHVFGPLGMEETSYLFASLDPENLATPYTIQGSTVYLDQQYSWPIYPIGNLKVSALQLAKHLCMYMNQGTYNNAVVLQSETIDLITAHHYINPNLNAYFGLIWFIDPYPWFYSHTGRWIGFNTMYGFSKEENYGMVWLSNGDNYDQMGQTATLWYDLILYSAQYEPFPIEAMEIVDEDGDGILEAGEEVDLFMSIRNYTNLLDSVTDMEITISSTAAQIGMISDPVTAAGNLHYQDTFLNTEDPVSFTISDPLVPGYIDMILTCSWDEDHSYETTLKLYAGNPDILLVRDETDERGLYNRTADRYTSVLDSLGFHYIYYDKEVMGEPTQSFINQFPVVIWYTGFDSINTLTEADQTLLTGFLDNGGKLFLTGQDISDELAGSDFLENYLHAVHLEDTWTGMQAIGGIDGDPIGDGLIFLVNQGDGASSQYSMSVVEPLEGAYKSFGYWTDLEGAGIRFEDNTFQSVFFAFGFEAITDFENRFTVMSRILNDYFGMIVSNDDRAASVNTSNRLTVFPNPSASDVHFSYSLSQRSHVSLEILDMQGNLVQQLESESKPAGNHSMVWEHPSLPAGVYFCILKTNQKIRTAKMIKR